MSTCAFFILPFVRIQPRNVDSVAFACCRLSGFQKISFLNYSSLYLRLPPFSLEIQILKYGIELLCDTPRLFLHFQDITKSTLVGTCSFREVAWRNSSGNEACFMFCWLQAKLTIPRHSDMEICPWNLEWSIPIASAWEAPSRQLAKGQAHEAYHGLDRLALSPIMLSGSHIALRLWVTLMFAPCGFSFSLFQHHKTALYRTNIFVQIVKDTPSGSRTSHTDSIITFSFHTKPFALISYKENDPPLGLEAVSRPPACPSPCGSTLWVRFPRSCVLPLDD